MNNLALWDFSQGGFDHEDKETSTEWKYRIEDKTLYFAFKYSDSDLDWKQNFTFLPRLQKPYKEMKTPWFAHSGFLKKWKAVEDEVVASIEFVKAHVDIDGMVIIGHSQGGAMAILLHEWMCFNNPNFPIRTVTFGAPRLVWFWNFKKLRERFEGITQYRDKKDLVPHLPPKFFGYVDVGEIVNQGDKFNLFKVIGNLVTKWHTSYGENL